MYFTTYSSPGSIKRAAMDGSAPSELVSGLNNPAGITIDFQNSRLYWTCAGDAKIESSDMQGRDIQSTLQRPSNSFTFGIGLTTDRLYWTDHQGNKIGSSTKTGQDTRDLYPGASGLNHVSVVPRSNHPSRNRTNHCENKACSKVCVLTRTSSRCMS